MTTKETSLTGGSIIRWGSFLFTIGGVLVATALYASTLKGDINELKSKLVDSQLAQEKRDNIVDKRIDKVEVRLDDSEKNFSLISAKLDVANAILQRVEAKLEQQSKK